MPHQQASYPSIKDAIESAEYCGGKKDKAMALFSVGIESSVIVRRIVNGVKASYLLASYWLFLLGITLIILGLLLVLLW